MRKIVAPIGVPIISDKAIVSKSRPTTAKVKVEIDIRRTRVTEIRIDVRKENGEIEFISQKVKYENVPEYCFHCKVQGHSDAKCRVLHPELRDTFINDNLDGKNEPHQSNNEKMKNLPKIQDKMQVDKSDDPKKVEGKQKEKNRRRDASFRR
ncbi:hypothetical protein KY290_005530 [Solanum tuberosum]|uniref:Uncharacterized protein n=1 Tax=Solanum tuberosum TaxID=4113 RepID=A0ABQ7WEH8_SOLTU|nr:hypothetical protein KY289_005918 [Solanum tuberosum]KAH0753300.1 hypothetical protein KY285_006448 [Solanum tuberosum]KAH0779103.1 hypothetical protein KY290_005530 [Solanum tuberosum]